MPEISYKELQYLFDWNLSFRDKMKLQEFKRFIDLKNLRLFFLKRPLDPRGNLNHKEIEEAIEVGNFFPSYVLDFLKREESFDAKLKFFPYLFAKFFQEKREGFNEKCFQMEQELRLVLTALRAKKLDRDLLFELQYEDPTNFFIRDILSQNSQEEYVPPAEYSRVKELYENLVQDPKELYKAMLEFRVKRIEELVEDKPFTIDFLLGYFAHFLLVEDWNQLDSAKGKAVLESIVA